MVKNRVFRYSMTMLFLAAFITIAWAGQRKTSAPPPATAKPVSAATVRPTERRTEATQRTQQRTQQRTERTQRTQKTQKTTERTQKTEKTADPPKPTDKNRSQYKDAPQDIRKPLGRGGNEIQRADGKKVFTNSKNEVTRIESPHGLDGDKMVINRGARGGRFVETGRPGARVVSYGPHHGFVERPIAGRPGYISRTYVRDGRPNAHVYHEYRYHDRPYYRYVHGYYYDRRFYGWAGVPWGPHVRYAWYGFAEPPAPWFGYYHLYFAPEPGYASADLWLTDFLLAENLHLAYENEHAERTDQAEPPPDGEQPAAASLSPQVKGYIADEVRRQLKAESEESVQPTASRSAAQTGQVPPPALDPAEQHFVVSSNLSVTAADGPCDLSPGDVIFRIDDQPDPNNNIQVKVVSSKQNDCRVGARTMLTVNDLQEMHNSFQEQIDSGLKTLANNQAKGLPTGPDAKPRQVADGTADVAPDAEAQIGKQETDAANLEAQVRQN